jgi:hypothetical protein
MACVARFTRRAGKPIARLLVLAVDRPVWSAMARATVRPAKGKASTSARPARAGIVTNAARVTVLGNARTAGGTGYDLQIDPKLPWREKQRLREQAEEGLPVGADAEYLRWALETFPVPLPPLFESPWDVA